MNCPVLAHLQLGWEVRSFASSSACESTWSPQCARPHWVPGQLRVLGNGMNKAMELPRYVVEQ